MEPIIAGRFESIAKADAAAVLLNEFVDATDICIFYNNPAGQHGVMLAGGDEIVDSESHSAHGHAVATGASAAVAAGAVGMLGGPVVALAAAGVAAYTGSLVGAMHGMKDKEQENAPHRESGVMLAVRLANPQNETRVISTLTDEGAQDIEHAQGEWKGGDWTDFNPVDVPDLH